MVEKTKFSQFRIKNNIPMHFTKLEEHADLLKTEV